MNPQAIEHLKAERARNKSVRVLRQAGFLSLDDYIAAGFSARELKEAGFALNRPIYETFANLGRRRDLIKAGFNELDFDQIGISARDLKADSLRCDELLSVGWQIETLRLDQFYGEAKVHEALENIAKAHHGEASPAPRVPFSLLKAAGCSVEELKEAGFHRTELKTQGAWDSPTESAHVDSVFGEEEVWRELEQMRATDSAPITLDQIGEARNSYLKAVQTMLSHRDERRKLKKSRKQIERRLKDVKAWRDDLRQKFNAQRKLEEMIRQFDELEQNRKAEEKEVADKREALVKTIDKRIKHLKEEIKFQKKKSKVIRSSIDDRTSYLRSPFGPIAIANHENAKSSYPLERLTTSQRHAKIFQIEAELGQPENVVLSDLKHPVEEITTVKSRTGRTKKKWVSSEEAAYKNKPLEHLSFLDAKRELVDWVTQDHEAEIEMLEDIKEMARNAKALWRPVLSKVSYLTLLGLARFVTTEVRMPTLFNPGAALAPIKWRRITGRIDFNLEFGVSVGTGVAQAADLSLGLNIGLSGSLAMEDDRRLRANITLKLIPNLEAKFLSTGVGYVAKASVKLGFTVTSQGMAFVDEKHFAHYLVFRMANLWNFSEKLMKYGARGLDYEHDPFSETIQKIAHDQLGGKTAADFYQEQRLYLTQMPVIKSHMPLAGRLIPTVDLGAESSVVGISVGASKAFRTPTYFQKEILALPSAKEAPAEESYEGLEYWEYEAKGDGDCAYHSISFLLHKSGLTDAPRSVTELRNLAATKIQQIYQRGFNRGEPIWNIDTANYADLNDYLSWIRPGKVDTEGRHRHWADLPVIAALAEAHACRIHIHQENQDTIELPPYSFRAAPVIHLGYRNGNHYNPLFVNEDDEPPVPADQLPPGIVRAPAYDAALKLKETGMVLLGPSEPLWRLDKRKPPTASERRAEKKALLRKYTPRLITLGRMGNSHSISAKIALSSWVSLGFEIGKTVINHHINPDNDGNYVNIKTRGSLLQCSFAAPAEEGQITDAGRDAIDPSGGTFGDIWQWCAPPSNLGLDSVANALGPVGISTDFFTRYMEWNFVHEGGWWRKQYKRWNCTSGFSVEVSQSVDVYPGVTVGASLSCGVSKSVALRETLGTNTLSYLITVFNGLKLRPDGKKQWDDFCKKHPRDLKVLYRRLGEAKNKDNGSNDKKLPNVYKVTRGYEALVRDNKGVWEDHEGDPAKQAWCPKKANENDACKLIEACQQHAASLKTSWRRRVAGALFPKYNPVPPCIDELNDRLTTLFHRVSRILALYDERMNPHKRSVKYLIPPQGRIGFKLRVRKDKFQVAAPPFVQYWEKASDAEWMRYPDAGSIWLNPTLRRATNALPFYRAGFAIDIDLYLPHSHHRVSFNPVGSEVASNDKDNDALLQQLFMSVAKEAVKKRKGNLEDFKALVQMDPEMERVFRCWYMHLGGDHIVPRKFRPNKTIKAKDHYPETMEGMELLPLDRDPSCIVLDKNELPKELPANELSQSKEAKKIQSLAAVPDLEPKYQEVAKEFEESAVDLSEGAVKQSKYSGHHIIHQEGLDDRQKWILKAHLLWSEWVLLKQRQLQEWGAEATNPVELILSRIEGPFPGYADIDHQFLEDLSSLGI